MMGKQPCGSMALPSWAGPQAEFQIINEISLGIAVPIDVYFSVQIEEYPFFVAFDNRLDEVFGSVHLSPQHYFEPRVPEKCPLTACTSKAIKSLEAIVHQIRFK